MIRVRCTCGKQLTLPDNLRSPEIRCPGCGGIFENPQAAQTSKALPVERPLRSPAHGSGDFWHKQPQTSKVLNWILLATVAVASGMLAVGLIVVVGMWGLSGLGLQILPQASSLTSQVSDLESTLGKFRTQRVPTTLAELETAYRSQPGLDKTAEWLRIVSELEPVDLRDPSKFPMHNTRGYAEGKITPNLRVPLEKLSKNHERVIASAQQMLSEPFVVYYPLHSTPVQADKIPEIRNSEKLARLLLYDAYRQSFLGDSTTATKRLVASLRIAATIEPYPSDIAQIFRYSIISQAAEALVCLLESSAIDKAQLSDLDQEFRRILQSNNAQSCLAGNLVVGLSGYAAPERTLDYLHGVASQRPSGQKAPLAATARNFEMDRAYFAARMYARLEVLDDRAKLKQLESIESSDSRASTFELANLLLNPLDKVHGFRCATWQSAEIARTAIAIERFRMAKNCLPAALPQLVPQYLELEPRDHLTGLPLQFKIDTDGYSLFSQAESELAKDASWQDFPPLKLRTSYRPSGRLAGAQANVVNQAPYQPAPSFGSSFTPVDGVEKMIRDANEQARANAETSRRMQQEHDAAKRPRQ